MDRLVHPSDDTTLEDFGRFQTQPMGIETDRIDPSVDQLKDRGIVITGQKEVVGKRITGSDTIVVDIDSNIVVETDDGIVTLLAQGLQQGQGQQG